MMNNITWLPLVQRVDLTSILHIERKNKNCGLRASLTVQMREKRESVFLSGRCIPLYKIISNLPSTDLHVFAL